MLTIRGQHQPRTDTGRLYVLRKAGRKSLMEIEGAYIAEIIKLEECVERTQDPLCRFLGHNKATHIQHYFKQPRNSRNLFKVPQKNKKRQ
jgi:hypothetical protein